MVFVGRVYDAVVEVFFPFGRQQVANPTAFSFALFAVKDNRKLIHFVFAQCACHHSHEPPPEAKCFAGDVGSVSIAFILLFLIGRLIIETEDFSWIVLLSVYGVDSVLTIIHRLMLHENIGLPHRKHLYQIMANELKIPHVMVSSIYMIVQAIIIVGYILCLDSGYWYLIGTVILLSFIYICFMKKFFRLHQF